ncbi:MAG: ABC transporter substrate-binding protein [Shinella sp.]
MALALLAGIAAVPQGAFAVVAFDQALQDKLPQAMRDAGKVTVATTAYTPPIVFMGPDNAEIIGLDADIVNAFSVMFGVKFEMTDLGNFAALIPALKAKRFDMSISGMGATVEREKELDMIPYMYDGKTIMVQQGNPLGIKTMEDLCGQKVAVGVGTAQEALVKKTSETKCKTPIEVLSIPKQPEVLIAVRTGRAAATVGGYATGVYTAKHQIQNGVGLEALPEVRQDVGYNTIALSKDNAELRDAVMAAFQKLIESGEYAKMLEKWELAPLAIENARLNDAENLPKD